MQSTSSTRHLASGIMDYIHEHPETHQQANWFNKTACGTTMCVAGTALFLKYGIRNVREAVDLMDGADLFETFVGPMLGLDGEEANALFYEMSNERALDKLAKIANGVEFDEDDFETEEN